MNENNAFYRAGFGLASADQELPSEAVDTLFYKSAALRQSDAYKHAACEAVKNIYQMDQATDQFGYHYTDTIMRRGLAGDQFAKQAQEKVVDILTEVAADHPEEMEKYAKGAGAGLLASLSGALVPAATKGLLFAGGAAGAGLGSLHWYLNRHSREDEAEVEQMKAKVEAYQRVSDEIEQKLRDAGIEHDPASLERRIESDIEGSNVSYSGL